VKKQISPADYTGARGSNAGDEFHELWAVRKALALLERRTGLSAVSLEGVDPQGEAGTETTWAGVDCALYYGSDTVTGATRIEIEQLKYSGSDPQAPWTIASLTKTTRATGNNSILRRLADAFRGLADQRGGSANGVILRLVSNRPVDPHVVDVLRSAATPPKRKLQAGTLSERDQLIQASGLTDALFSPFAEALDLTSRTGSRFAIEEDVLKVILTWTDDDTRVVLDRLRSFVGKKMLPEAKGELISAENVLHQFNFASWGALFPCPPELQPISNPVPRSAASKVVEQMVAGTQFGGSGPNGSTITLKNGTVLFFETVGPPSGTFFHQFLTDVRDRYGNQITITRNSSNDQDITQITSPNGRYLQFSYDSSHRITQIKDNIGRTVSYAYDTQGRLSTVTDANGGITTYTYDKTTIDEMLTIKDPKGTVALTNQYDANKRVTKQTLANASTYLFAYTLDGNGNVIQTNVTDPRGFVRKLTFDASGYVLTDIEALGKPEQQTVSYARQQPGELISSTTDTLGRQTTFSYDGVGNVTGITRIAGSPNAVTTTFSYEPQFSGLASMTDPLNHAVSLGYDSIGNVTSITDPLTQQATFTYNSAGQLLTAKDALNYTAQYSYDGGDLVQVIDPLGNINSRFVDAAGRTVSATDPLGNTAKYSYDSLGRLTNATDPLGNGTSLTYDPNSNLLSVVDARNSTTSFTYDTLNRLATRKDPLLRTESYAYDASGNLSTFTDRKGQLTTFTYDGLDRRTFVGFGTVVQGHTTTYQSTTNYTYDGASRITQLTDSVSGTITNSFDGLDRLTSQITPQGSISYTYDNGNRRGSMTVAGQPTVAYSVDSGNRLTQMTQGSAVVGFGYDAANRGTSVILPNAVTISYGFDAASRVTGITYTLGNTTLGTLVYTYDKDGQRISMGSSLGQTSLPPAVASASYNADNQLTNWSGTTISSDANGNITNDGTNTYGWNARNQLNSVNAGSLQYDPFGRRTSNLLGTKFLYDGQGVVQELSGATPTANVLSGGLDEVFTRTDSTGARYFLRDALGSTLALTDSSGAVQTQYAFDPFGNTTASGFASSNTMQYTGRENDSSGLYYDRARYYSPRLHRFISEDPIGVSGGLNLFAYVSDSPTNFTDPLGLLKLCDRPVRFSKGLGWACHGFLELSNPDGSVTTYGGYNEHGHIVPELNYRDDSPTNPNRKETKCKDCPTSKSEEDKVRKAFDDLKHQFDDYKLSSGHYPYYLDSGVSTSIAQTVLQNAGLPYTFPKNCFGWIPTVIPAWPSGTQQPLPPTRPFSPVYP